MWKLVDVEERIYKYMHYGFFLATKSKQSYSDLQSSDGESVTPSAPDEEVQEDDESVQETSKSGIVIILENALSMSSDKSFILIV